MRRPFFTIGHSNRSIDAFIELLRASQVEVVVDVRTLPGSRANPQFNDDALAEQLGLVQIGYLRLAALGGLRGRQRGVDPSPNGLWRVRSFQNYADHAMGDAFASDFAKLRQVGHARTAAIMCAEAVWWRCHRRIIADYLLVAGEEVRHILGPGRVEPARLTPGAVPLADGRVAYPTATSDVEPQRVEA